MKNLLFFFVLFNFSGIAFAQNPCEENKKRFLDSANKYFDSEPKDILKGIQWYDAIKMLCKDPETDIQIENEIHARFAKINKDLEDVRERKQALFEQIKKTNIALDKAKKFQDIFEFSGSRYAWAYQDQFFGVIDTGGNLRGTFEYENPQPFNNGYALAMLNGKYVIVNGASGKPENSNLYDFLIKFNSNNYYGAQGKTKYILNHHSKASLSLLEDTGATWQYGLYPVLNSDRSISMLVGDQFQKNNLRFQKYRILNNQFWFLPPGADAKWGVYSMDLNTALVSPNQYDKILPGRQNKFIVEEKGKYYTLADKILLKDVDTVFNLNNGYFLAGTKAGNDKFRWGIIDDNGKTTELLKYHHAEIQNGNEVVLNTDQKEWFVFLPNALYEHLPYDPDFWVREINGNSMVVEYYNKKTGNKKDKQIQNLKKEPIIVREKSPEIFGLHDDLEFNKKEGYYVITNGKSKKQSRIFHRIKRNIKRSGLNFQLAAPTSDDFPKIKFMEETDDLLQVWFPDDKTWSVYNKNLDAIKGLSGFNKISNLGNGNFLCHKTSRSVLIDKTGNISRVYKNLREIIYFPNEQLLVAQDSTNHWGCMNMNGAVIIPFSYSDSKDIIALNDRFLFAKGKKNTQTYSRESDLYSMNPDSSEIRHFRYDPFEPGSTVSGLFPGSINYADGRKLYRYYKQAEVFNKAEQYEFASEIKNGYSLVLHNNQWFLLDHNVPNVNKIEIDASHKINTEFYLNGGVSRSTFQENHFAPVSNFGVDVPNKRLLVKTTAGWRFLSIRGSWGTETYEVLTTPDPVTGVSASIIKYAGNKSKSGYHIQTKTNTIDLDSATIIKDNYLDNFINGYSRIIHQENNKTSVRFLNSQGALVGTDHDFASNFHDGLILIRNAANKYYYSDDPNTGLNYFQSKSNYSYLFFDEATVFQNNRAFVKYNGAWKLISNQNNAASINFTMDTSYLEKSRMKKKTLTKSLNITAFWTDLSLKDANGISNKIIDYPKQYFSEGEPVAVLKASVSDLPDSRKFATLPKWGIINLNGKIVVPFEYDSITPMKKNVWLLEKNSRFGLYMAESNRLIDPKYQVFGNFDSIKNNGTTEVWIRANKNGKWGWIDLQGKKKIEFLYTSSTPFEDGKAWVTQIPYESPFQINQNGEIILDSIKAAKR